MKLSLPTLRIAQKLPLILIGSALVVGVGIGIAAYVIGLKTVDQQRAERMDASVQTGLDGVQAYLHDVSIDLSTAAARPETAVQIQQMRQAFRTTENGQQVLRDAYITNSGFGPGERLTLDEGGPTVAKYDALHKRYHASWRTLLQQRGYDDILLFSEEGRLVYSVQKNDDFVADFGKGSGDPLSETGLAGMMRKAMELADGALLRRDQ